LGDTKVIGFMSFIASGCYGMAYMMPKPYCYFTLGFSTFLVAWMRASV